MTPGPTRDEATVLNADVLAFLHDQRNEFMAEVGAIKTHLATLNGIVAQNVRDVATNRISAAALTELIRQACIDVAVLKQQTQASSLEIGTMGKRIWDIGLRVAEIGALVLILMKVSGLW
jgi:hypothetical protein